jgi:hypothetical protein
MEFREFLELEEAELFDLGIDQIDEGLGSALKFAAGAGGNLLSQAARGGLNATTGIGQSAIGASQGVLAALQAASGGLKKGRDTFDRAYSNVSGGGRRIGRGIAQLGGAFSGVSPILRGAQAASEPLGISGAYAPASKNRSYLQDLFGLDSWEKEAEKEKAVDQPTVSRHQPKPVSRSRPNPTKPKPTSPIDSASAFLGDLEKRERSPNSPKPQPEAWKRLVVMYKAARTREERDAIRSKMRLVNPYLYQQAVEAGKQKRIKR